MPRLRWVSLVLVLTGVPGLFAASAPVAVSPGRADEVVLVESRCPTFSWSQVDGASGYELVVYRLTGDETATEALRESFEGSVNGWTPSLDRCLEKGGRYAWSVRSIGERGSAQWSSPSLFEVPWGPSEVEFADALEVVRKYLAQRPESPGEPTGDGERPGGTPWAEISPPAGDQQAANSSAAVAAGDADLQVNGSPVVTVATLAGALCSSTELRFLDRGDGTVLDCNTGLIWTKLANCFGARTWPEAKADVDNLASGACSLTDRSTAGQWRLPTIAEFCSRGALYGVCPPQHAADSLINTAFAAPTVSNAAGDAKWAHEDAFVGVSPLKYWSGSFGPARWAADLSDGLIDYASDNSNFLVWPVRGGQ